MNKKGEEKVKMERERSGCKETKKKEVEVLLVEADEGKNGRWREG